MGKRIAVLVRERQGEALRVALGLTLADAAVEVYVLDRALEATDEIAAHLGALRELGMALGTNTPANPGLELLANEEIARRILACDVIEAY